MSTEHESGAGQRSAAWRAVDRSGASEDMAAYLERAATTMEPLRRMSLDALRLSSGGTALDAGCGTGVAAFELADIVGPTGVVHATDMSAAMVDTVRARSDGTVVRPDVGDVRAIVLPDDSCDAARTERVLIHLTPLECEHAVAELVRVVRPGGRISLLETCHAQSRIDGDDVLLPSAARSVANATAGLQLRRLLLEAGCEDVASTCLPMVFTSIDELHPVVRLQILMDAARRQGVDDAIVSETMDDLADRDRDGTFQAVMIFYLASGTVS